MDLCEFLMLVFQGKRPEYIHQKIRSENPKPKSMINLKKRGAHDSLAFQGYLVKVALSDTLGSVTR